MSVAIFGVLFFLLAYTESSPSFELLDGNSNKLCDSDWQCDTICLGSGGRARFDPENKICKCTMDKNTDEIDALVLKKNALNTGLASRYNYLKKRNIPEAQNPETEKVGAAKFKKFELKKFKPVLPKLNKFKKFLPKSKMKFDTKARNAKHAKEDSDAKHRFKEMQDKFKDKLEGLKWKLPNMKQRSAFKEASEKANDLKKKKEQRKHRFSLKSKNIVGQPTPTITAEKTVQINPAEKPIVDSNKISTAPNKIPTDSNKIPGESNKLPTFNIFGQKGIFNSKDNGASKNNSNQEIHANNYPKQEIITQPSNLYNDDDSEEDDVK